MRTGKRRMELALGLSTALSRTPATQRSGVEGDPGPSAKLANRRLLFLSQRSPLGEVGASSTNLLSRDKLSPARRIMTARGGRNDCAHRRLSGRRREPDERDALARILPAGRAGDDRRGGADHARGDVPRQRAEL